MKVNDYIRLKAQLSKIYDELDNLQPVNFVMYNNIQYNFNLHLENVGVAQYSALESAEYNYRNDFWELLPNIVAHLMYTNDLIINDEIFFDGNRVDEFYDVVMDLSVAEIFAVHKAYALKKILRMRLDTSIAALQEMETMKMELMRIAQAKNLEINLN